MADTPAPAARVQIGQSARGQIVAPSIGAQRCANCKFQEALGGAFGDVKLCLEAPPQAFVVPDTYAIIPPGTTNVSIGDGLAANFPTGGLQVIHVRNEVRYPPAPDDFKCGRWKPRLAI